MKRSTNWKQLTMKQVKLLFSNTEKVTDWEKKFIESLKDTKFKVSVKQLTIVNKILGKIAYKNSGDYWKKQISVNKNYNLDAWSKIENSN